MATTLEIKRPSIDDLVGYDGVEARDKPEEQKIENPLVFDGLDALLEKYKKGLEFRHSANFDSWMMEQHLDLPLLHPEQINTFLQVTIEYNIHSYYSINTGLFVALLMKKSYAGGNTKFCLNTKHLGKKIDWIGYNLKAEEKSPAEINIEGHLGDDCGYDAEYITINANSVGKGCGNSSRCMRLYTNIIGNDVGYSSEDMTIVTNIIGKGVGWKANRLLLKARIIELECGKGATDSVFKVSDMLALMKLSRDVLEPARNNEIYFIHSDGMEEKVWPK